jgi:hypothetical protein
LNDICPLVHIPGVNEGEFTANECCPNTALTHIY